MWIITIIVVDGIFRYLTRKVISGYTDGPSALAVVFGTPRTDGSDARRDDRRGAPPVRGLTGSALSASATPTSTDAAPLTSRISARWGHQCLAKCMEVKGAQGRLELSLVGGYGEEEGREKTNWFCGLLTDKSSGDGQCLPQFHVLFYVLRLTHFEADWRGLLLPSHTHIQTHDLRFSPSLQGNGQGHLAHP